MPKKPLISSCDGTLQLLFTDVILPGSGGKDLARQLRSRYPKMKTILMSGYARNTALPCVDRDASVSFLSKPFTVAALMQKVEESLAEKFESALSGERSFQESASGR